VARARKEIHWDWPVDYARHRGVSRQAVHKAIAEGRIELVQGRINRELADQEWQANSARPADQPGSAGAPAADAARDAAIPTRAGDSDRAPRLSYNEARTAWQWYRARIAQLEYEERAGRLADVEQMKAAAFEEARRLQEKILAMPDRIAPFLAGKPRAECARILRIELRRVLEDAAGRPVAPPPAAAKAS
jgi:hypothetical protein